MNNDALDRKERRRLSIKQRQDYARKRAAEDEAKELRNPMIVKKQSDKFKQIVERQLRDAGL